VVPIAPIDRNLNRYVWSRHGNGSTKVGGDPLEIQRAARRILINLIGFILVSPVGWSFEAGSEPVAAGSDWTRDYMMIVGSSTIFPFVQAAHERINEDNSLKMPMMQNTGSGGGLMFFCAGSGELDADITCASRQIRDSELEKCRANGVGAITELKIGYGGIVKGACTALLN
jgi:ABC-type phosphate transport system substrate-binding protein